MEIEEEDPIPSITVKVSFVIIPVLLLISTINWCFSKIKTNGSLENKF